MTFKMLNTIKQLSSKAFLSAFALLALFGLSLSCGKRTPPVPPNERVSQRAEISGFQRGDEVLLSWKMPARNAPSGSTLFIDRVDVYRLTEPNDRPQTLSEEEFASRSTLIATLKINDGDFSLKTFTFKDKLQFAGQAARLRYAVRFVNQAGQKAAFSNFFLIQPASSIASAPTSLTQNVTQEAIELKWQAPQTNIDGSTPVNIIGYNIYRSLSKAEPAKLLNNIPVLETEYSDRGFEFTKDHFYFVRAISLGSGGEPVESQETSIIEVKPVDTFAPAAPSSITLAATPTTISIFFATNIETDIAGYKIYRSTDREKPLAQWELLTPELLKTNTFTDQRVEPGKTYYYYLTATDVFGNLSQNSEIVNETMPN